MVDVYTYFCPKYFSSKANAANMRISFNRVRISIAISIASTACNLSTAQAQDAHAFKLVKHILSKKIRKL